MLLPLYFLRNCLYFSSLRIVCIRALGSPLKGSICMMALLMSRCFVVSLSRYLTFSLPTVLKMSNIFFGVKRLQYILFMSVCPFIQTSIRPSAHFTILSWIHYCQGNVKAKRSDRRADGTKE